MASGKPEVFLCKLMLLCIELDSAYLPAGWSVGGLAVFANAKADREKSGCSTSADYKLQTSVEEASSKLSPSPPL